MSTPCALRTTYKDGSECGAPASYRVHGVACYKCVEIAEFDSCVGHVVCAEHAMKLRTDSVAQVSANSQKDVGAFTVELIYSLAHARDCRCDDCCSEAQSEQQYAGLS